MLISIIIPAYNVENYIEECVHSAFRQTYPHIEVICIDNNSTDHTWQKLQNLQQLYPSLIIDKELKPGAPAARNKGLQMSKGEWLQFLDADDLLMPEKIKHQVNMINKNTAVPFIAAASIKRDVADKETPIAAKKQNPLKSLFSTQLGNTCANLWNRKYIEAIKGWDELMKSSQEADLMFRLLQVKDEVLYDDEPLTIVRERPEGQISQTNHTEKWSRYFKKRVEMLRWIAEQKPTLYAQEKGFFEDTLFGILKIMANENLKVANALYKKHLLKNRYRPSLNQNHSTRPYLLLYKVFGFWGAEVVRRRLGK